MKKENNNNNKGFSLVELIVVIAIMAVLMVVLAPALLRYVEKARVQTDETTASDVLSAVETALSDDEVYQKVAGTDTIRVDYVGSTGLISTGSADLLNELDATLKADGSHKIKTTSSKLRKNQTYEITATYESTKMCYVVTGQWK